MTSHLSNLPQQPSPSTVAEPNAISVSIYIVLVLLHAFASETNFTIY